MEESSQVRKEESCGNRVQHDEAEIWRKSEFEGLDGTTKRTVDQSGPAQHRTTQLLGVVLVVVLVLIAGLMLKRGPLGAVLRR